MRRSLSEPVTEALEGRFPANQWRGACHGIAQDVGPSTAVSLSATFLAK